MFHLFGSESEPKTSSLKIFFFVFNYVHMWRKRFVHMNAKVTEARRGYQITWIQS